mgnify:CR=1 FL=1
MKADHVTGTLKLALEASGWDRVNVIHKPRLLSDNGSSYISGDLVNGLKARAWIMFGVRHTTPKFRAKSNAGTKHSRIGCCLRITFYRVISKCTSETLSIITIITATMRVSTISARRYLLRA